MVTMKHSRLLLAVPAVALAMASLTACTSSNYACSGDTCTVNLSGAGAETEISGDVSVSLVGASNGVAEYTVDGDTSTCAEGDTQQVGQFTVVCTEVGDDKVSLKIS